MTPTVRTFAPSGAVRDVTFPPKAALMKAKSNVAARLSFEEIILRVVELPDRETSLKIKLIYKASGV